MAGNLSNFLENKLLEHSLGKTSWTMPTTVYAALFTIAPTDSSGGTEVTGGSYARQAATWGSASLGTIATNAQLRFPAGVGVASASWGTVVAVGVFDALTVGNLLYYGPVSASVTVNTGEFYSIASGDLTISLD